LTGAGKGISFPQTYKRLIVTGNVASLIYTGKGFSFSQELTSTGKGLLLSKNQYIYWSWQGHHFHKLLICWLRLINHFHIDFNW